MYGRNATVRQQFEAAFGYDPSDPRETVTSSIPQALAMMNGVRINLAVRAIDDETVLGRLLERDRRQRARSSTNCICARCRASRPTTNSKRRSSSAASTKNRDGRVRRPVLGAAEFVRVFTSTVAD